jgi:hypothetical protein
MTRFFDVSDIHYQDNNAKNYYCMDFSVELVNGDGLSGSPTVTDTVRGGGTSDLVVEDISVSGEYVCMYISSGTPHKTYVIEVECATSGNLNLADDGFLRIGD